MTILRIHHGIFEEVSSKGIGKLGGDDVDAALGKIIGDRFQEKTGYDILNSPYKQQFMLAVERAKIDLSDNQTAVARKAELVPERHLSLEEEIDRATFERAIMPLIVKSGTAIDEAMKLRGMRPKDIDKVLLVGGTSKIPMIRRYVSEKLAGKEAESFDRVDPMTCVAQGAAIVSAILQALPGLDNYAYSVKLEHSLCANPVDQRTNRVFLDPIIKRGADIPCSYNKTYYPVADPADRVLISVYEGDNYDNPDSPENVKLAEIPWEFKPPRPQRDGGLEVAFEYGDDGILTVQIQDMYAGSEEAFRHPASRRGPDGRVAAYQAEAHQRGPRQQDDGAGIDAGIQGRLGGAEKDGAGRDSAHRESGGSPRVGGAVPAGAAGDGFGRPQEDGRGRGAAERSAAELRVFAVTTSVPAAQRTAKRQLSAFRSAARGWS